MTAPVFLALTPGQVPGVGQTLTITGSEAHHMAVMRLNAGERIDLVDGEGTRARAVVRHCERRCAEVDILDVTTDEVASPRLIMVQALAKGGRDQHAIEMATEIGVDTIVAWQSQRSIVRWEHASVDRHLGKWRDTVVAATKQSRRARLPQLGFAANVRQVIERVREAGGDDVIVLVLHESATTPVTEVVTQAKPASAIAVVVGPEGGITDAELGEFSGSGAHVVVIGDTVMRASTAGVVGLSAARALAGHLWSDTASERTPTAPSAR